MRRIIVVGCPGSGKTTLALKLGVKLGIPVTHLDTLYWRADWQPSDNASFRERVGEAIGNDHWIADGSFSGLAFDLTLARADTLIVIERPRWLCLRRVVWRSLFQRDVTRRPDLPVGCPEKLDWNLVKDVWHYNGKRRPRIESERSKFGQHVAIVTLNSDREIDEYLSGLDDQPLPM